MKVYVAGPITGWPDKNRPAFEKAEVELGSLGHEVYTPFMHEGGGDLPYEEYLKLGLILMLSCDGVAMLPEWHTSTGATIEHDLAEKVRMHVLDLSEWLDPMIGPRA